MSNCYITFRSVTPAQRGERVLKRTGVDCILQRTPKWMEEKGCGYTLRLRHRDAAAAVQVLQAQQIPYRKVYLYRESGLMEELQL